VPHPPRTKSISSRVILEGHGILNDLNTLVPLKKNEFNSQRRVKRAALFAVSRVRCTDRSTTGLSARFGGEFVEAVIN